MRPDIKDGAVDASCLNLAYDMRNDKIEAPNWAENVAGNTFPTNVPARQKLLSEDLIHTSKSIWNPPLSMSLNFELRAPFSCVHAAEMAMALLRR